MKVYILTEGREGDLSVEGVFSTREKAAEHWKNAHLSTGGIIEMVLDERCGQVYRPVWSGSIDVATGEYEGSLHPSNYVWANPAEKAPAPLLLDGGKRIYVTSFEHGTDARQQAETARARHLAEAAK